MVLIISSVSGIVNVMCLLMLAAACLLILGFVGTIVTVQCAQWNPDYKMWKHNISMLFWDTNIRASGIRVCFPQLLKYQNFLSINSMLKGIVLYFLSSP